MDLVLPPTKSKPNHLLLLFLCSCSPPCRIGQQQWGYRELQLVLEGYGVPSVVVKVSRPDWLRNTAGLLDANYWRVTLRPRPILDWYLTRVDKAVREANELAQGGSLSLVRHSVGGWLACVFIEEFGLSDVALLLTIGTPHLSPPKGIPGVIDQTRGLLDYFNENCSKAVYTPQLKYIKGDKIFGDSQAGVISAVPVDRDQLISEMTIAKDDTTSGWTSPTRLARFVEQGYKQVCGRAYIWGDGVVPVESAHLEGALNISLDGVYHTPIGSDDDSRPWYGSPTKVEKWIGHLLD